jgi:hypothetical protein
MEDEAMEHNLGFRFTTSSPSPLMSLVTSNTAILRMQASPGTSLLTHLIYYNLHILDDLQEKRDRIFIPFSPFPSDIFPVFYHEPLRKDHK